ncbi:hypothetical protein Taro_022245 [Colocasia esculenta]|uniref:Homologous-pairing protein 2 homolog n=1 Tax=Colocasia esculenta TaxID=4460 RepID=A0A843UTV7_COLES|nr:hypothetical protein [Colocasia esculenta]
MPPKSDSVEGIVLSFVNEQNRPLNSQNVADALQKYNLKKTSIQKALDSLSDSGQISFKEYGKQKIYLARQDQFNIANAEELDQMKKANSKLQEDLEVQKKAISEVEAEDLLISCPKHTLFVMNVLIAEVRVLQSNLTLAEIHAKESRLKTEVREMEKKLKILSEGTPLVDPEERKKVEETYLEKINQWRKRKRIFKDLWNSITENSPKDEKEFKEELGIEYDEDVGVSFQAFSELLSNGKKRRMQ